MNLNLQQLFGANVVEVSIPIRDLMNLNPDTLLIFNRLQVVSIPIRDLMNLNPIVAPIEAFGVLFQSLLGI